MTTKERILERIASLIEAAEKDFVVVGRNTPAESLVLGRAAALATAFAVITEEFAKEGEESAPIYIIEFRPKDGEWQIFDMDGDRSRERAESYIPSNQVAYPDCEFRVVKYQRVEGGK